MTPPASDAPIRVMIVDDSAVIRGLLTRYVDAEDDLYVVATAADGKMALDSLKRAEPDVAILDIEMPGMDGMMALPQLIAADPKLQVLMASTLTRQNAEISLKAMSLGAADYLAKPTSRSELHNSDHFKR
ncbi:MAG: response regulator, partial [Pseudomonadota bacterium]